MVVCSSCIIQIDVINYEKYYHQVDDYVLNALIILVVIDWWTEFQGS